MLDFSRRLGYAETIGETLSGWQDLTSSLTNNTSEVPHLESHRTRLADLLKQAQDLTTQQAALMASKQETSKKLQKILDEGRKLATFLRVGVRQHYGTRAEKLVEFGLRPFRSRRRSEASPHRHTGKSGGSARRAFRESARKTREFAWAVEDTIRRMERKP